jgi:hypothetical protein
MKIFNLRDHVISDFQLNVESFLNIRDERSGTLSAGSSLAFENRMCPNTVRHVYCCDVICLIKIEEDNEVSIHVK